MQKKAKVPEPPGESAPMWIVSFADLVTLMMSFFVVLYAMKQGGEKRQLEVAAAIKNVFDPSYQPETDSPFDMEIRRQRGNPGPPYKDNGGHATKPTNSPDGTEAQVSTIRPGKQIVTGTKITFELNGTTLDGPSKEVIRQISVALVGFNNVLFIKGHVSMDEIKLRSEDPDGTILSFQRATAVADELVKNGISRKVLRPVACGINEPVKSGAYDAESMRQNRRVEVYATDTTASDFATISTVQATEKVATAEEKK